MPRNRGGKPPVKPIGRILYSERWPDRRLSDDAVAKFEHVCDCKGHSGDKPFSLFRATNLKDSKPFKVVFHWTNEHPTKVKVKRSPSFVAPRPMLGYACQTSSVPSWATRVPSNSRPGLPR